MKKADLVNSLSRYAHKGEGRARGQNILALFLAHYFDALDIPAAQRRDDRHIDSYIPQLLLSAFEEFRTTNDVWISGLRAQYEQEAGDPFPNLTELGASDYTNQLLTILTISPIISDVTNNRYIESWIDALFNAESHLLRQAFYTFVNRVFRRGLFAVINECSDRGMSGTFGKTKLLSFANTGRLMLTFARPTSGETAEQSVSFLGSDDDPLALSSGIKSVYTSLPTALAMLTEVIMHWPDDPAMQKQIYRTDRNASLF